MVNEESNQKKSNSKSRFGFSRMKNATKFAAKKFNRMLVKAKTKLIKKSVNLVDISIASVSSQFTEESYIDDEFEEIDLNELSEYSTMLTEDVNLHNNIENRENRSSRYSFNSTVTVLADISTIPNESIDESVAETTLNDSNAMHKIFVESIADLHLICTQHETQSIEMKTFTHRGTPSKVKLSKRLKLCDRNCEIQPIKGDKKYDQNVDQIEHELNDPEPEKITYNDLSVWWELGAKQKRGLHSPNHLYIKERKPKESFAKRIAQTYREIRQAIISNSTFLVAFG